MCVKGHNKVNRQPMKWEKIFTNHISDNSQSMRGDPKYWNLFIKNCVFILTCLNLSHLQSTRHLM